MKRTGLLLVALLCAATGVMAQTKGSRPEPQPASKQEWASAISRKIQRGVRLPRPIKGVSGLHTAKIAFVVHRDGTITDVVVQESSGVPQVDEGARQAILRSSPVTAFSPDMTGETEKVVVPIRMEMILPNPTTKDDATGLTFTTPAELESTGKVDPPGTETVKYNLISTAPDRIPNAPGSALCQLGFRAWAKDHPRYGWSQEKLNGDAMFGELGTTLRSQLETAGKVIEDTQTIDMKDAKAVEIVAAPTSGPDFENVLHYAAFTDTPTGRITLSCATTRAAMSAARPVFKALAQTVQIVR
ncbi:TonB family protein [Neorhizobium sp. JUb45]|uniref:TonB family protein n=1 Tax=unclassified Neorhizobium TaxID=2629175 RepID=UPI00140556CF|nr:TonB family protein [Neorhizobium sp. JUb45]